MTDRRESAPRRLSRLEGERRSRRSIGVSSSQGAIRRDIAVHDAVRLLGLEPATGPESEYDARGPDIRYRIAGCTSADPLLPAGAFRSGHWDRGLLVSMTVELEPLAIDELTSEAAETNRSVTGLRATGRRLWRRG